MKHKIILFLAAMLLAATCVGCGNQPHNDDILLDHQEQDTNLPSVIKCLKPIRVLRMSRTPRQAMACLKSVRQTAQSWNFLTLAARLPPHITMVM